MTLSLRRVSLLAVTRHLAGGSHAEDLGFTDQVIWNFLRGQWFRMSLYAGATWNTEIDVAHLERPRLAKVADARGHVGVVHVGERVRRARQRERALHVREIDVVLRRADRRHQ